MMYQGEAGTSIGIIQNGGAEFCTYTSTYFENDKNYVDVEYFIKLMCDAGVKASVSAAISTALFPTQADVKASDKLYPSYEGHKGIDFPVAQGTPIQHAAVGGKVVESVNIWG